MRVLGRCQAEASVVSAAALEAGAAAAAAAGAVLGTGAGVGAGQRLCGAEWPLSCLLRKVAGSDGWEGG